VVAGQGFSGAIQGTNPGANPVANPVANPGADPGANPGPHTLRISMEYAAASILALVSLIGLALTIVTLPGAWLICAAAVLVKALWVPDIFEWWLVAVLVGLAIVGEVIELVAGALGAAKGGGSKKGAIGAVLGTLAGAIGGSFFIPPIGTVIGAVAGAGIGSAAAEMYWAKRSWQDAAKAGTGAAIGRLIATFFKVSITLAIGLTVCIAAFAR
jgi:uncharacterized protein